MNQKFGDSVQYSVQIGSNFIDSFRALVILRKYEYVYGFVVFRKYMVKKG
jgi:hypothetical protein